MSLTLNIPKYVALHSNSKTTSKHAPQVESNDFGCKTTNENHRGPAPNEKLH